MKEIKIDWDYKTRDLLGKVINGALTSAYYSGIPIDPEYYESIEKIKQLRLYTGELIIKVKDLY